MKKGFLVALVITLMMSITNVSAMTKDELKTKLTKEYTINGATFKASASDIAQIERYLEQNNISEADADKISAKVDEAVSIIEAGNATKLEELTTINPRLALENKRIDIEAPYKIELSFKEKLEMLKGESLKSIVMNFIKKD